MKVERAGFLPQNQQCFKPLEEKESSKHVNNTHSKVLLPSVAHNYFAKISFKADLSDALLNLKNTNEEAFNPKKKKLDDLLDVNSQLKTGSRVYQTLRFNFNQSELFRALSNDNNEIHYMQNGIVPAKWVELQLSGILGSKFPGEGTIFRASAMKYVKPILYNKDYQMICTLYKAESGKGANIGNIAVVIIDPNEKDEKERFKMYGFAEVQHPSKISLN